MELTQNTILDERIVEQSLDSHSTEGGLDDLSVAREILTEVLQFRRSVAGGETVLDESLEAWLAPHLPRVLAAVSRREPITFVLPAFPGKSPNPEKVFGPRPDMAERLALQFLNKLCLRIGQRYEPGARMILCSDGRVFADSVGMLDEDITTYQNELDELIAQIGPGNFSKFNLDMWSDQEFSELRSRLMAEYGNSLESLQEKVRRGAKHSDDPEDLEAHRVYLGITRFLFEDALHAGQTMSRAAIQRDARNRAYQTILRSNAWSNLIAERFPGAVRLSIHPQPAGSAKLGIRLIETEVWMTPWHGVAVETDKGFVIMKRRDAEQIGAQLIRDAEGRASHYVMNP